MNGKQNIYELEQIFKDESGSCINAAGEMDMHPSALSLILNRHRMPTPSEERRLINHLGLHRYQRFFGPPRYFAGTATIEERAGQ